MSSLYGAASEPDRHAILRSAVLPMTISDLVAQSTTVLLGSVVGTVGMGQALLSGADISIPFTDVRVSVTQYLTEKLVFHEVNIRTLGGTTPSVAFEAPEEPTFRQGEEVVVFVCKDTGNLFDLPDDTFTVQGLFQGKYSVVREGEEDFAVGGEGRTVVRLQALLEQIGHGPAGAV